MYVMCVPGKQTLRSDIKLELMVVRYHVGALKPESSVRTIHAFNHFF